MIRLDSVLKTFLQDVLNTSQNVWKASWRCLEDVLKTSWKRLEDVLKTFLQDLLKTSCRRFEDVLKTSWRRLGSVLKTSWRCLEDVLARRLENVFKTSWRRLLKTYEYSEYVRLDQDVLKTSSEDERHLQDAFKTFSPRRMFAWI